jgi:hypothetical protein
MSGLPPVRIITTDTPRSLRILLRQHGVLEEVEAGQRIVLLEGRSLTDLDHIVPPGKTLAVIAFHLLGGG